MKTVSMKYCDTEHQGGWQRVNVTFGCARKYWLYFARRARLLMRWGGLMYICICMSILRSGTTCNQTCPPFISGYVNNSKRRMHMHIWALVAYIAVTCSSCLLVCVCDYSRCTCEIQHQGTSVLRTGIVHIRTPCRHPYNELKVQRWSNGNFKHKQAGMLHSETCVPLQIFLKHRSPVHFTPSTPAHSARIPTVDEICDEKNWRTRCS